VPGKGEFLGEITRLDKSNVSFAHGFRAAVLVVAPLFIGFATGHPELILATLGAMFLTNTEGPNSSPLPVRFLVLACLTEAAAFGVGTLVGLTGLLAIPLAGIGVFIALLEGGGAKLAQVGKFTAIVFAVGVGLPGGSTGAAVERFWLLLLGGLLALLGAWAHRSLTKSSGAASGTPKPWRSELKAFIHDLRLVAPSSSEGFRNAAAIGVASAFGLAVGLGLGLPRDFWIVVTIILATRPKVGPTISFASMIVLGTFAGAVIAAAITLGISNSYVLGGLMLVFGTVMFATRGVNLGLSQLFFTPFIIILLNILYPGEWYLAEIRILDVAIGGAIAIVTVYMLSIRSVLHDLRGKGAMPGDPAPRGGSPTTHSSLNGTPRRFDRFRRSWAT
jgi:hypothetical protein